MNVFPVYFIGRTMETSCQLFCVFVLHHDHLDAVEFQSLSQLVLPIADDGQFGIDHKEIKPNGITHIVEPLIEMFIVILFHRDDCPVATSEDGWHVVGIDILAVDHD